MSGEPKVSIALPVRNGMPHLKDAIGALRAQTYGNIELLVQDSISTDGSAAYIREAGLPFPVHIVSEHDGSLVAGYNRAFGRCSGELVVAAACDEMLDADAVARYVSWYSEHPDALYIYGGSRIRGPDGTLTEYQPKEFGLIDYVRHQMCPTTAGAFNRRLLGRELRLDESLQTVPDFEFFTRIALRFGEHRIVCKRAITMTARGDSASMSFRPESFANFARDKRLVLDRLFGGDSRNALLEYFHRDVLFHMHLQFAAQIYSLGGDGPYFRTQLMAAQEEMPHQPELRRLAAMSRHFRWDAATKRLILRSNVPPLRPPRGRTVVLGRLPAAAIRSESHWLAAGARADEEKQGVRVRTPDAAWHYAASGRLGDGPVRAHSHWYWLRFLFSDVEGRPMLSLFDAERNILHNEMLLEDGAGEQEVFLELEEAADTHFLVRNGDLPQSSSLLIRSVEVLVMPIVPELAA